MWDELKPFIIAGFSVGLGVLLNNLTKAAWDLGAKVVALGTQIELLRKDLKIVEERITSIPKMQQDINAAFKKIEILEDSSTSTQ